jgi:hypothetical protein
MRFKNFPSFCGPCLEKQAAECKHEHSHFQGGLHFTAGEVWDDIMEVCDDCGVYLNSLTNTSDLVAVEDEMND